MGWVISASKTPLANARAAGEAPGDEPGGRLAAAQFKDRKGRSTGV
jgi:hypothetical protein